VPEIELHLLINAYDDGQSTGELREFLPGMLGPSDFRKNLSYLVDLFSNQQFAMVNLLEYRLPRDLAPGQVEGLLAFVETGRAGPHLPAPLVRCLGAIDRAARARVLEYLRTFALYYRKSSRGLAFADCSIGNLLFSGAYLKHGRNFNAATRNLADVFVSKARLVNVTNGENRTLVGLREDGQVLDREARIVSDGSAARIADLFLLPQPLGAEDWRRLAGAPVAQKAMFLKGLEAPVGLSAEARDAILRSDIILYGPGTQFSSLFPSYKTRGIGEALAASPAKVKAFVVNLDADNDIRTLGATDLVDKALFFLGDEENSTRLITHVLYDAGGPGLGNRVPRGAAWPGEGRRYKNVAWAAGSYRNPVRPAVHSGVATVRAVLSLYDSACSRSDNALDIYLDLNERSLAVPMIVQELLELDWTAYVSGVRLTLNKVPALPVDLPEHFRIETSMNRGLFSEVEVFGRWLRSGRSEYLATISGDGEYRLRDILAGLALLKSNRFGVVYGSRNQSRRQLQRSLLSAYGESKVLSSLSWAGSFLLSILLGLKHGVLFSDPLTGFRMYKRSAVSGKLAPAELAGKRTPTALTKLLIRKSVEIAEVPVVYRTFKGFTNVRWRLSRGVTNVWHACS
jgi:2-phospho-L-lactate transferase/gluconeogenesis factor (CofD/UPF0052 family)